MLDVRKLAEQRKAEFQRRQQESLSRWSPYIDIVEGYYKEEGRELKETAKVNIAQCCDNLFDFYVLSKLDEGISEATTSSAIAFARQMLPTIPALLPALVADHVSIVQAIDRPQAQLYYMNVNASVAKGDVAKGSQLIGAKVGHASGQGARGYASDTVYSETNKAGAAARTLTLDAVANKPLIPGSVKVTNATVTPSGKAQALETYTDDYSEDGTYTLTGSLGSTGTYTPSTGVIVLDAGSGGTIDAATHAKVTYRWDIESYPEGIGGLDFEVTPTDVDAQVFPLKLNYNVMSAILLQKVHGMILADEGMKFCTQEIRFAIDQVILQNALDAANSTGAATAVPTFDAAVDSGQEWIWRAHQIKRSFSIGSANIFAKTLRCQANVIVGGINVTALLEILPDYKPAAGIGTKPPSGPYVHGTLGSRLVICNPFFDANQYVELFRGDNYLYAGLAYCPYVPLYATDPITLADLTVQRGFMSMAAVKRINDGMFCYGDIDNF